MKSRVTDTQYNTTTIMLNVVMLSVAFYLFLMLSFLMLIVVMLSAAFYLLFMLSFVMLNVLFYLLLY